MLKELLEYAGYEPRSYSGRGMYGKQCIGVSCSSIQQLFQAILHVAIDNEETDILVDELVYEGANWDNLGRDWIVYWPDQEWNDDE